MSTQHTDRELLELAARAAGIAIVPCTCKNPKWPFKHGGEWSGGHWNPLEADGDALRLAVALRMEIDHNHPSDSEPWVSARAAGARTSQVEDFEDEAQRITAIRRAIVRAAASAVKEGGADVETRAPAP